MARIPFILIAEDEPAHAEAIRRAFDTGEDQAELQIVSTLGEYRQVSAARTPDMALVDVNLPDGQAFQVLTSPPDAGDFPVVAMTSHGNERMAVEAMKAGAIDYIAKSPEAFTDMPHTVRRAMDQWRRLQQARRTERQLVESERLLQRAVAELTTIYANVPVAIILVDSDRRVVKVNDAAARFAGQTEEKMIGLLTGSAIRCVHALDAPEACGAGPSCSVCPIRLAVLDTLATGQMHGNVEAWLPFVVGDTTENRCLIASVSYLELEGAGRALVCIQDITDRKRTEESMRLSEERFRTLVESITDYSYKVSIGNGRILETVHASGCLGVTGYSPEDFHADTGLWLRMVHPEDQRAVFGWAARLSSGLKVAALEHRIFRKNGEIRWVRSSAVLRYDHRGQYTGYEGVIQDITEYKRLQGQFVQAQKMEAIGLLAGGVAHDFRNQLTVIHGYVEMLLRRSLAKEEGRAMLQEVLKAAERSATTTARLLAFSRRETLWARVQSLRDCVADIGKILPQVIGEDIRLVLLPSNDDCTANVDPHLFQQAIMNLVTNARDAMPEGGALTVETARVTLGAESQRIDPDLVAGEYVVLRVTDTGNGMDEATLARVLDPFFTTKEVGKGTGLGLPMVYGFVKQSGGAIEIQSEPGRGTTVRLYFPHHVAPAAVEGPAGQETQPLLGGSETILVVEDEPTVQAIAVEMLQEAGYHVLKAANAEEALGVVERYDGTVDMVLTDVVMPGMSGVLLAEQLRRRRPGLGVLYFSGYPGNKLLARGVNESMTVVTKPFTGESLMAQVRHTLDASKAASGT